MLARSSLSSAFRGCRSASLQNRILCQTSSVRWSVRHIQQPHYYAAVYIVLPEHHMQQAGAEQQRASELTRDSKIWFLQRNKTGHMDGALSLVAGHIDPFETAPEAAVRESKEEIGVDIAVDQVDVKQIMHRVSKSSSPLAREYFDIYVVPRVWSGVPVNREPSKCSALVQLTIGQALDLPLFPAKAQDGMSLVPYVHSALKQLVEIDRHNRKAKCNFIELLHID